MHPDATSSLVQKEADKKWGVPWVKLGTLKIPVQPVDPMTGANPVLCEHLMEATGRGDAVTHAESVAWMQKWYVKATLMY